MGISKVTFLLLVAAVGSVVCQDEEYDPGCTTNSLTKPGWLIQNSGVSTPASFVLVNQATKTSTEVACLPPASPGGQSSCSIKGGIAEGGKLDVQLHVQDSAPWLIVKESWLCSDMSFGSPTTFSATGNIPFPSSPTNTTFPASLVAPIRITPNFTGNSYMESCTVSSFTYPSWRISDFSTSGSTGSLGTLQFNIEFQLGDEVAPNPTTIVGTGVDLSPVAEGTEPKWYPCTFLPGTTPPKAPSSCTFQFNPESKDLALRTEWVCSDLDERNPITFSGVMSPTTIPELACTTEGTKTTCATGEARSWIVGIGSVSWRSVG